MGFANRVMLAAAAGFAAAALAGCGGSSGLLSQGDANRLNTELTNASSALNAGNCTGAAVALASFRSSVESLYSVNQTLISNLDSGAQKIMGLALKECGRHTDTQTATTPTTTTTETTPTVTTTSPVVTTPAVTTTPTVTTPAVTSTPAVSTPATPGTSSPTGTPQSGGSGLLGNSGNSGTG